MADGSRSLWMRLTRGDDLPVREEKFYLALHLLLDSPSIFFKKRKFLNYPSAPSSPYPPPFRLLFVFQPPSPFSLTTMSLLRYRSLSLSRPLFPRSSVFFPLRLLSLPQQPHSSAPASSNPRLLPAPEHRPSPAPGAPCPQASTLFAPPIYRPSFGLFGRTEGLCSAKQDRTKALCSATTSVKPTAFVRPVWLNEGLLFGQTGPNRGLVWSNDVERKAGAREGGPGLMPRSGKETEPKEEGTVLGRGGDEGGTRERGEGGGQETEAGVWR